MVRWLDGQRVFFTLTIQPSDHFSYQNLKNILLIFLRKETVSMIMILIRLL